MEITLGPAQTVRMVHPGIEVNLINTSNTGDIRSTIQMESCRKIFIPRDYSQGLNVHFETHFPMAFRGKVTLYCSNSCFYLQVCLATILETLLGCATCYCSRLISDTIYQKKMNTLSEFIDQENQQTYNPAGFHIINPMQRGLRTVCVVRVDSSPRQGVRRFHQEG
ncbi:unnamed protein product [Angiostrongylus costaricensis]|uniref:Ras modification protein ERF4 n=1 Tax=Angiostrongylus costaricensis TaxID=334426 RepID=A0A0R3PL10_ANGCS|nr:unnamed protein product [Angiostrongylus costaricensis]